MTSKKPVAKPIKKFAKFIRWSKIVAKFAAISTTIAGGIAAMASSSAATTGFAIGAAGATSYAATKTVYGSNYDKIKHIAPQRTIRQQRDIEDMEMESFLEPKKNTQTLKQAYASSSKQQKAG